jgi:nicotinate-nucleotide adenylyltransferase
MKRVGIFSGVFDPVHNGHIAFALEAVQKTNLDEVYFLVEAKPRRKSDVTHLAHRIAMVKLAIQPHASLKILDLPDKQFSVAKTLPRLKHQFKNDELLFIAGSDMLQHMPQWPLASQMFAQMGLIVGVRQQDTRGEVQKLVNQLPTRPNKMHIINSPNPRTSSGQIRSDFLSGKKSNELTPEINEYIKTNWLYVAPSGSSSVS